MITYFANNLDEIIVVCIWLSFAEALKNISIGGAKIKND
jgi:hypothetical protein